MLKKGKSKKTVSKNIKELVKSKPGKARAKGIKTLSKRSGLSPAKAKQKQSVAIALNKAGKSKKSKKPKKLKK